MTLSDKRIEQIGFGKDTDSFQYEEKDVKEFIKETREDIEGGYEGEELLQRLKKRSGEKLI